MSIYSNLDDKFFAATSQVTVGTDPEICAVIMKDNKPVVVSPALLEVMSGLTNLNDDPTDLRTPEEKLKHPFYIKTPEYKWQMDGVAFELTINAPYTSVLDLKYIFSDATADLSRLLGKVRFDSKAVRLVQRPVVPIDVDMYTPYLENEKIYQGFIFGCDPDEDAILPDYKCETVDVSTHPYRYFGGHIHVGHEDPAVAELFKKLVKPFVQLLACTVGVFCISNTLYTKDETLRAQQYGRPGRFRPQEWGLEYRTPSVSWLAMDDNHLYKLDYAIKSAVYYLLNPDLGRRVIHENLSGAITAIQTCDKQLAYRTAQRTVIGS